MGVHKLSCSNCNKPFKVHLPEDANNISYTKCGGSDKRYHDLKHIVQCKNCDERNTIYYCTETHPSLLAED